MKRKTTFKTLKMGCLKLDISKNYEPILRVVGKNLTTKKMDVDYYPFGMTMPGREFVGGDKYRYGFQNQEEDEETGWVNYKYRMHDPRLGRFFSRDPLAKQFPHNSPYAFSENRVLDAVELEGLEAFPIHGTWGTNEAWTPELMEDLTSVFGNDTYSVKGGLGKSNTSWSGGNADKYRRAAAQEMVKYIKANRKPGEPITVIGHSHGGNVGVLTINMLVEDPEFADAEFNLLTMNTPVREYQLSATALARVNHYQVYNNKKDKPQASGGNSIKLFSGKKMIFGFLPSGELGKAGKTFNSAINIGYNSVLGGIQGNHQSWKPANTGAWLGSLNSAVNGHPAVSTPTGGSGMGAIERGDKLNILIDL